MVKIPSDIDLRYAGPLGCGFMIGAGSIFDVMKPEFGTSLVVFGTDAVGLNALMAANLQGYRQIIAVDIHDTRLDLAKQLGATHIVNSTKENPIEAIKETTNGGADYSFETTGIDSVELNAIRCLKNYRKMITVALGTKDIRISLTKDVVLRSLTIRGVVVVEGDAVPQLFILKIIQLWQQNKFPFGQLIQFYDPKNIEQAFEDSKTGKVIKSVLVFDPNYRPHE
ncbi:zinc-binding dehydrogenase [Commensalibacter oyaizuii]|uniref:Zinc-binding dehydrogenase n=1 Tax=Commensalibacter oyaizuii TaxID=3043873 RepID=A0ABT6Q1Y8_9PROT|nr:zinc-binding dehydrogenase [Commensalibacter sp. TBRC 16381]MDI2090993.1 zinc-binding dehydrogenase [Commensalibacter sp. TBRC 16381]